jgi:hypothetical protein
MKYICLILIVGACAWAQSQPEEFKPKPGAGKEIGGGAANIGTGVPKGAGNLAKGTGKGAAIGGKDVAVGTAKGTGKIGKASRSYSSIRSENL